MKEIIFGLTLNSEGGWYFFSFWLCFLKGDSTKYFSSLRFSFLEGNDTNEIYGGRQERRIFPIFLSGCIGANWRACGLSPHPRKTQNKLENVTSGSIFSIIVIRVTPLPSMNPSPLEQVSYLRLCQAFILITLQSLQNSQRLH